MASKTKWIGAVSTAERGVLLGPPPCVTADGQLTWQTSPVSVRGHLPLQVHRDIVVETPAVVMTIPVQRPWEINLVYRVNGAPMIRVDVNGKHDGWPVGTHRHDLAPTGNEIASKLPGFPGPPIARPVTLADLRDCFEAFLKLCSIGHLPETWTDIPGWR